MILGRDNPQSDAVQPNEKSSWSRDRDRADDPHVLKFQLWVTNGGTSNFASG